MNRFALLRGRTVDYRPGWDCHGLPIELKALQTLPREELLAAQPDPMAIRRHAKEYAIEAVSNQRNDFWRWGVMADWEWGGSSTSPGGISEAATKSDPMDAAESGSIYITMAPQYEAAQLGVFRDMVLSGLVHRGLKPVHWSPSSKTALAEAELEYSDDHVSESVFVAFPVCSLPKSSVTPPPPPLGLPPSIAKMVEKNSLSFVIWTTTPWTLPANMALAVHPDVEYTVMEMESGVPSRHVLVASDLVDELQISMFETDKEPPSSAAEVWKNTGVTCTGSRLVGLGAKPPFGANENARVPIIPAEHVTVDSGTGVVHTAPGHGQDDFVAWSQWRGSLIGQSFDSQVELDSQEGEESKGESDDDQDILCPVDDEGRYVNEIGVMTGGVMDGLEGRPVVGKESVNQDVVALLRKHCLLLRHDHHVHRYPYDWRTKEPTIVRATKQWFVDLHVELKDAARDSLRDVEMTPKSSRNRLESMVDGRDSWCISRQRSWGVPIPVFYRMNFNTGEEEVLATKESMNHVIGMIRERGTNCWWESSMEELLPPGMTEEERQGWRKCTDTLDVWFDSGCSWAARVETTTRELEAVNVMHNNNASAALSPSPSLGSSSLGSRPADVYLEGSDQHRGWFQSSLLTNVASQYAAKLAARSGDDEKEDDEGEELRERILRTPYQAPYRQLVTHGFVLDEHGKKMSKSVGNVIEPSAIINGGIGALQQEAEDAMLAEAEAAEAAEAAEENNQEGVQKKKKRKKKKKKKKRKGKKPHKWSPYGADVLRLWAASSDYTRDVVIGPKVIEKSSESLRKIRNTARYVLGNLHDFDPSSMLTRREDLSPIDRLFLHRTALFLNETRDHYQDHHFRKVVDCLQSYVSNDLSSFYFEISKDTLYTSGKESKRRRSAQTTLHYALSALLAVIGPIIPFTTEDVYQYRAIAVQQLQAEKRGEETGEQIKATSDKVFESVPGESAFRVLSWREHQQEQQGEQDDKQEEHEDEHERMLTSSWCVMNTSDYLDASLEDAWLPVSQLREKVHYALEVARKEKKAVGSSLDAKVELVSSSWSTAEISNEMSPQLELEAFGGLANIFVVSQVSFVDSSTVAGGGNASGDLPECFAQETVELLLNSGRTIDVTIRVVAPEGEKCPRCWKYGTTVFGKGVVKPSCGCEL